jgi:DNA-binding MarR family transcriptional regulator
MRALEADLKRDHGLTLAQYDVLLNLWLSPDKRMRMSELARAVQYSSGATTKLLSPLVKNGLVTRESDEDDRRSVYAALSVTGRQVFRRAGREHLPAVEREFAVHVHESELTPVRRFLRRIAEGDSPSR